MKNLMLFLVILFSIHSQAKNYSEYKDWSFKVQMESKKDKAVYTKAIHEAQKILKNHFIGEPKHPVRFILGYVNPKYCKNIKYSDPRTWGEKQSFCFSLGVCMAHPSGFPRNRIMFFVGRSDRNSHKEWVLIAIHELIHCYYGIDHMEGTIMAPNDSHYTYFLNAHGGDLGPFIKEIEVHYKRGTAPLFIPRPK